MVVDHIGYAVKDIQRARIEFEYLGYSFSELIQDYDRNLYIQFGVNGSEKIELLQTMDNNNVTEILKKNGATPYHICYKTDNLQREIKKLEERKFFIIKPPARAIALQGGAHRHVGLIELVENVT